jgi:hypothetical protein
MQLEWFHVVIALGAVAAVVVTLLGRREDRKARDEAVLDEAERQSLYRRLLAKKMLDAAHDERNRRNRKEE